MKEVAREPLIVELDLSVRAENALSRAGVWTIAELRKVDLAEVGLGSRMHRRAIAEALAAWDAQAALRAQQRPTVRCSCCHGTGQVTLDDTLWRTLARLRASPDGAPMRVLRVPGETTRHVSARLKALVNLGLVIEHRTRPRTWTATVTG